MASKSYGWDVRNITKISQKTAKKNSFFDFFSIFSKTVHTIRTKIFTVILQHIVVWSILSVSSVKYLETCQESCNFLKPFVRILTRFLPRAPKLCTTLQDLAKNFKKNVEFFRLKKRRKSVFSTKNLPGKTKNFVKKSKKIKKRQEYSQEIREMQEMPRILTRVSKEKLTKVNENKQKPTPTSA